MMKMWKKKQKNLDNIAEKFIKALESGATETQLNLEPLVTELKKRTGNVIGYCIIDVIRANIKACNYCCYTIKKFQFQKMSFQSLGTTWFEKALAVIQMDQLNIDIFCGQFCSYLLRALS